MKNRMSLQRRRPGLTLPELMIGLSVSSLLIVGLVKLYSTVVSGYSLQGQIVEMNQNARFVMKEMTDVISQAGANCAAINSDSLDKDTIIRVASASNVFIRTNVRGGLYIFPSQITNVNTSSTCSLQVDNAYQFFGSDSVGKIPKQNSTVNFVRKYRLNTVNQESNMVYISGGAAKDTFYAGDAIYSYSCNRYYLSGTNFCLNNDTNVLAENIDSLTISFFNLSGASTTNWQLIRSARFVVESTTSSADSRYKGYADHKRRIKLVNQFRLRNRV
jgi:hypothetical protein